MTGYELPETINFGGIDYRIRTDFRAVLDILVAMNDPDVSEEAKPHIVFQVMYPEWRNIPPEYIQEACEKACEFIDMGMKEDGRRKPHTMDWEQDAAVIIPSVNRVIGKEIRSLPYLHWWTFLGAYMEIGESLFSQILNIRQKKARGKKLEKWEQEFYRDNKALIDLQVKRVERSQEEKDELRALFGFSDKNKPC